MGVFKPSRGVFRAIGDALGLLEADSATSGYENGPVKPRLDVQGSLEAGASEISEFILKRTDVGADDTEVDINVHVLGDWTEIRNRRRTLIAVPGSAVPPEHDAWIIGCGVTVTVGGVLTLADVFTEAPTVGAGSGIVTLFDANGNNAAKAALNTQGSPIMVVLPWWVPPVGLQTADLRFRLITTGAGVVNLCLTVLHAPQGVFRRLM